MNVRKDIPLVLAFDVGFTKKSIKELLNMNKGRVYRLEESEKEVVVIRVENQKIGEGRIVTQNGKMFVEITSLKKEGENS